MLRRSAYAIFALMLVGTLYAADSADTRTGLPLPDAASGLLLDSPMNIDATRVCRSTMSSNFYLASGASTSAAIAWYAAHLKGDGADSDIYAIVYGTMKPGMSEKTLMGLLSQHIVC